MAQQAMDEVYRPRIRREDEAFVSKVLGAIPSSLAVLSNFFVKPWTEPLPELNDATKANVLNWAGFRLRALGRLEAAKEPLATSLKMYEGWKDWEKAASAASNLAGLYLGLGEVGKAIGYAQKSVLYADQSRNAVEQASRRTTLADIYHHIGDLAEAEKYFEEAEKLHQENPEEECLYLYSLWGFRYCDFLLEQGHWAEVLKRAEEAGKANDCKQHKLDMAMNKLMFGRAYLAQAQKLDFRDTEVTQKAGDFINEAIAELRAANENHHLPKGFLARARFYRLTNTKPDIARKDLEEVRAISSHRRGNMRLYQTDYHLEAAWLELDEGKPDTARAHVVAAEKLIKETGYKRRLPELKTLQQNCR